MLRVIICLGGGGVQSNKCLSSLSNVNLFVYHLSLYLFVYLFGTWKKFRVDFNNPTVCFIASSLSNLSCSNLPPTLLWILVVSKC